MDGGDVSPLLILRYDDKQDDVDYVIEKFPDATIVFRYACDDADYKRAMLGCGVLLRFMLAKRSVVVIPKEYVKTFFDVGEDEVTPGATKLPSGVWLVVYDKINGTTMAEYERVKKGV